MDDPRLTKIAADTEAMKTHQREILRLRAERAAATWSLVNDPNVTPRPTIARIAREIKEPEIRFRKSVETYRDGIPKFKRRPDS